VTTSSPEAQHRRRNPGRRGRHGERTGDDLPPKSTTGDATRAAGDAAVNAPMALSCEPGGAAGTGDRGRNGRVRRGSMPSKGRRGDARLYIRSATPAKADSLGTSTTGDTVCLCDRVTSGPPRLVKAAWAGCPSRAKDPGNHGRFVPVPPDFAFRRTFRNRVISPQPWRRTMGRIDRARRSGCRGDLQGAYPGMWPRHPLRRRYEKRGFALMARRHVGSCEVFNHTCTPRPDGITEPDARNDLASERRTPRSKTSVTGA
jgi:hypothetical protein